MIGRDVTRVTVNLDSDLVQRLDQYAERMKISRTAATSVLLSMALENQSDMANLRELIDYLKSEARK